MNLETFANQFIQDIRNDSIIQNDTPSNVFLEDMSVRLQSMEYIFNPTILQFVKQGTNNRIMKLDMFAFDEIDKSLVLLTNDYIDDDEITTMNQQDINQHSQRMLNYLTEVSNKTIFNFIDPSHDAYKLALELNTRLKIDYTNAINDLSIERIKLFIITNKKLSKRVSNNKLADFEGRQVELNVWDIERIYDVVISGRDKEPVIINIPQLNGGNGIPYLKADFGEDADYDAYLTILPGKLLSDIYWDHGSRLLEGNVRAFLSAKGKVNSGIRRTIREEPKKFFTYNNGIACTAKSIAFSSDGNQIISIEDIQIINGGQTTASLTSALRKDGANLQNIYVPMKLTVINTEDYDDLIQNISRYANSQNKVTDADLFSNHPFHRLFEDFSLKISAPPKQGENHNTFWYYERSRGKYLQSQFKMSKKSDQEAYMRKYPKSQVVQKEDLAKYLMSGIFLRPDLVSRGRAKNMTEFAVEIDKQWKKDKHIFNEKYFKDAISFAIIYKYIDKHVSNSNWYQKGGIKLNIVPYTLSKIINSLPNDKTIDLNRIWKEQTVYKSFINEIDRVAQLSNKFINDSKGVISTEYAKRDETWEKFKQVHHELSNEFLQDLVSTEIFDAESSAARKDAKHIHNINIELEIFNLAQTENKNYWNRLLNEGIKRRILSLQEQEIIKNYICELAKSVPKRFPSPAQYKVAWMIRKKLEDNGVFV